jgi:hypothetical protein
MMAGENAKKIEVLIIWPDKSIQSISVVCMFETGN